MLLGSIEAVDHHGVRGWAVDTDRPFVAIEVAIFGDGRLIGIHPADRPRDDLKDPTGPGAGNHGFQFTFDSPLADDREHEIAVRFVEGGRLVGKWRVAQVKDPDLAEPKTTAGGDDDTAPLRRFIGHVDRCDAGGVAGWAAVEDAPDEVVSVVISMDGQDLACVVCDRVRADLVVSGRHGNGAHGFEYLFEAHSLTAMSSQEDQDHEIAVRFAEGGKLIGQWRIAPIPSPAEAPPDVESGTSAEERVPEPATHPFVGFVDRCDAYGVAGWAARMDQPDEVVSVAVMIDGQETARAVCDAFRGDLAESGAYGSGVHGFEYRFETPIPIGTTVRIDVRIAETDIALEGGGVSVTGLAADEPVIPETPLVGVRTASVMPAGRFVGTVDVISRRVLVGWAADRENPDAPVTVLVFVNGQRMAAVPCKTPRPDIVRTGQWASDAHGFRVAFDPPLPEDMDLQVVVRFLDSAEVLANGRKGFTATRTLALLGPILVTAPGRSGTTMLMERLGQCPEVVVANCHPYEVRMLSYYASAHRVLTAAADLKRSTHPDCLEGDGFFVGFNPFSEEDYKAAFEMKSRHEEFYSQFIPDETMRAFRHIIMEYYERNRDEQQKGRARFFAEKNNNLDLLPREFTRDLFGPTKEIVLVRDPRDLYCSRLSYFKNVPERTLLQEVRWACTQLRELHDAATPDMLFIKYEDIVQNNPAELARLSDFLGFDLATGDGTDEARFAAHGTSASPASSVGRWRTQLSEAEIVMFDESGAKFFETFGYEMGKSQ